MLINKAFEIIEDHPDDADFIGEIKEDIIDSAEAALNVKFPLSYRLFLRSMVLEIYLEKKFYGLGIEENDNLDKRKAYQIIYFLLLFRV